MNAKPLVYLACPYTHKHKWQMQKRHDAVTRIAAKLIKKGMAVFSPITNTHTMAELEEMPTDWPFWRSYDNAFLSCCNTLIVLKLDGWEHSVGLKAEIAIAKNLGLDIIYAEEKDFE